MDCEFCRKNMQNLIDNNLTKEQKSEMMNHIKNCDSCKKKYNYEKKITDDFKDVLHDYDPGFTSSRKSIMSRIDNEKYPLPFAQKFSYKLKKNKGIAAAAVVVIIAASATGVLASKFLNNDTVKQSASYSSTAASKDGTSETDKDAIDDALKSTANNEEKSQSTENIDKSAEKTEQTTSKEPAEEKSLDVFSSDIPSDKVISSMNVESQTPWEVNKENNYSACVLGKGEYAEEEGYASLIIKTPKGSLTEYKLKNEQSSQTTIVQTEWLDKDRVLVMTGSAYGTLVSGQKIYSININTGVTKLAFEPTAPKTQRIKKMESKGEGYLEITIAQYTDEALNNFKETIKTIRL